MANKDVLDKIDLCRKQLEADTMHKIQVLLKFYNVDNLIDLVVIQSHHVDKLQNKLQSTEGSFYIGNSRVG